MKKLNDKILQEYKIYDELLEIANIDSKTTGIKNVVVWVGPYPPEHRMRIKVSNVLNKSSTHTFSITIPDLRVVGKVNESFITPKVLEQIKRWITLNQRVIEEYSNREILTEDFLARLQKV